MNINFKNHLKHVMKFFCEHKFTSLSFFLLLVLGYLLNRQFSFTLINVISVFLLINILAKTFKYTFLLSFICFLFITADVAYFFIFSSSIYLGIFSSMLETTPIESREMFGEFKFYILAAFAIVGVLYTLSTLELRKKGLSLKLSIICFLLINLILIPGYLFINIKRDRDSLRVALYNENPLSWAQNVISGKFPIFYNDVAILTIYVRDKLRINRLLKQKKVIPEGITTDASNENDIQRIYLVVGETSFREHYSLYGYDTPTTPFLDSLRDNTKKLFYYEAISPACITRDAVRMSLTFSTPRNKDLFFTQKNIIELAKERGYETLWISNQERVDSYDNYTGVLASSSDITYFETQHGLYRNDLGLMQHLQHFSKPSRKQFIVLHLQGSHMPYVYRSDSIDIEAIPQTKTTQITNYDRTIHYTDRLLRKIYEYSLQNDEKSLIYYFSDHGECVGEGHGIISGGKEQFQIPLLIINNKTDLPIDSIVNNYKDNSLNLINTVNNIYILAELLGYKINPNVLENARDESKYVYHIDGNVHLYENIVPK